jgi:hypothetical protein
MASQTTTRIDFNMVKPLTLDGVPWDSIVAPPYPFNDTDTTQFYYYLIDNIPFLRHNERDTLFSKMTQASIVCGFPFKGNAAIDLSELMPVIIDFQAGYIHREFSKQTLAAYECIGVVLNNLGSTNPWYDDNGVRTYYVAVNVEDVFISYNDIVDYPNTAAQKNNLKPEFNQIYVNTSGLYTTNNTDPLLKVLDINGNAIPVAIIKAVDTVSPGRLLCSFNAEGVFGFTAGASQLDHSDLLDVKTVNNTTPDPDNPTDYISKWVYGHYGYATRIVTFVQTASSVAIGDPVHIVNDLVTRYTHTSPHRSFIGYVYAKSTSGTTDTIYVVTDGEYPLYSSSQIYGLTQQLEAGEVYYLDSDGALVTNFDTDPDSVYAKVGIALDTSTLLLETGTASLGADIITLQETTDSVKAYGTQVTATVKSSGIPVHHKFISNKHNIGKDPLLGKIASASTTAAEELTVHKDYIPFHNTWSTGVGTKTHWGWTDVTAGASYPASDPTLFTADAGVNRGFHTPKVGLIMQRLSPEFQSGHVYERVLVFTAANQVLINRMNALNNTATNTISGGVPFDLPMTSALDLTATGKLAPHTIATISSTKPDGTVITNGLANTGALKYVDITLLPNNDFRRTDVELVTPATGSSVYLPKSNTDTTNTNPGTSLKSQDGLLGFFKNATAQGTSYCYVYYRNYKLVSAATSTTGASYRFYDCYVTTKYISNFSSTYASAQFDKVVSFPAGGLSFNVGSSTNTNISIAGIYNSNPHHMNWLNKHKNSWFGFFAGGTAPTTPTYLLGCLGNPLMSVAVGNTNDTDQSIFSGLDGAVPYSQFEIKSGLASPMTGQGPTLNNYSYINYHTFYGNPWTNNALIPSDVTSMFRYNSFSRSGMLTAPWQSKFRDSFYFPSPTSALLGPAIRTSFVDWHGYKLFGAGTILYIYRGSTTDAVGQDYVDISLDETTLAFSSMGNWGHQSILAAPITTLTATEDVGATTGACAGDYNYIVSYVDINGAETLASSAVASVTKSTAKRVNLTAIPVGPTGTAKRKIYRSRVDTVSPYYLLSNGIITDNSTTTLSDIDEDITTPDTALTGAESAAGTGPANGDYQYIVTFYTATLESNPSPVSLVITVAGGFDVDLADIPVGPAGTVGRKIYRTTVDTPGYYYLLSNGTIADNATTTLTDSDDDTDLTAMYTQTYSGYNMNTYTGASVYYDYISGALSGDFNYKVVYLDANGYELAVSPSVTWGPGEGSTTLMTFVSNYPAGTVTRKIYRTKDGPAATYYLLDTLTDSTILTYTDTIADSALTVPYTTSLTPLSRQNFDFVTIINGQQRAYGPGDTIRMWLPPVNANDLRTSEGAKEISTRNNPYLELTYSSGGGGTPGTYSISGTITGTIGSKTVTITAVGPSGTLTATATGTSASWTITSLAAGTYTITPSATDATFTPSSKSVTITTANITGQDFAMTNVTGTTVPLCTDPIWASADKTFIDDNAYTTGISAYQPNPSGQMCIKYITGDSTHAYWKWKILAGAHINECYTGICLRTTTVSNEYYTTVGSGYVGPAIMTGGLSLYTNYATAGFGISTSSTYSSIGDMQSNTHSVCP